MCFKLQAIRATPQKPCYPEDLYGSYGISLCSVVAERAGQGNLALAERLWVGN